MIIIEFFILLVTIGITLGCYTSESLQGEVYSAVDNSRLDNALGTLGNGSTQTGGYKSKEMSHENDMQIFLERNKLI